MTKEELIQLWDLLTKWLGEPQWNKTSHAWGNICETRRQVEVEMRELDPTHDFEYSE